jgi:hypothetical protein
MAETTEQFLDRAYDALAELFVAAKAKNEVGYAAALSPEFRGEQGPGWSAAEESRYAFKDYLEFLKEPKRDKSEIKTRVAMGFYNHLAEASGYYECPKNLLRIVTDEGYSSFPEWAGLAEAIVILQSHSYLALQHAGIGPSSKSLEETNLTDEMLRQLFWDAEKGQFVGRWELIPF